MKPGQDDDDEDDEDANPSTDDDGTFILSPILLAFYFLKTWKDLADVVEDVVEGDSGVIAGGDDDDDDDEEK